MASGSDTVLINVISTRETPLAVASGMAVSNSHIMAVGADAAVLKTRGAHTHIIDLHYKTVIPVSSIRICICSMVPSRCMV